MMTNGAVAPTTMRLSRILAFKRDSIRRIDRVIDYFGGASVARGGASRRRPRIRLRHGRIPRSEVDGR
jgi:hypothetical protein